MRVTGRKDEFGEVKEFICNTCRFDKKATSDWVIEGPTKVKRTSVISLNHYEDPNPPAVVKTNLALQEANKEQFDRVDKLLP